MAIAWNTEVIRNIGGRDGDRLRLALDDLGHGLAGELHQLALEGANTGFAGVLLADRHQGII
ncbi:hypothetical protein D3C87_1958140 [compost metagenome]